MVGNNNWTPVRVKNFMKELKKKPTKWDENIEFLAGQICIAVEEFLAMNPITYGVKLWGNFNASFIILEKIMGQKTYNHYWFLYNSCECRDEQEKEEIIKKRIEYIEKKQDDIVENQVHVPPLQMQEIGVQTDDVRFIPDCPGCVDQQPNQLAHMDVGGCLYNYEQFA